MLVCLAPLAPLSTGLMWLWLCSQTCASTDAITCDHKLQLHSFTRMTTWVTTAQQHVLLLLAKCTFLFALHLVASTAQQAALRVTTPCMELTSTVWWAEKLYTEMQEMIFWPKYLFFVLFFARTQTRVPQPSTLGWLWTNRVETAPCWKPRVNTVLLGQRGTASPHNSKQPLLTSNLEDFLLSS